MRVAFDTKVYLSAFLVPGGKGEQAFLFARRGLVSYGDARAALKLIGRAATIGRPASRINVFVDEPDNRILECAVSAAADAIVTGDRHLLELTRFRGIAIVRLADFLRMFPPEPGE